MGSIRVPRVLGVRPAAVFDKCPEGFRRLKWFLPPRRTGGCTRDARAPQKNADGSESSSLPKIGECLRKSAGNLIKRLEARFYFGGMHSGGGASPERFTVATLIDSRV